MFFVSLLVLAHSQKEQVAVFYLERIISVHTIINNYQDTYICFYLYACIHKCKEYSNNAVKQLVNLGASIAKRS